MPISPNFIPQTIHTTLGSHFYDEVEPAGFSEFTLRYRDNEAAKRIGLETLSAEEWLVHFGRFKPLEGSIQKPLALRYHGHQFRNYNPELGDGRGFLYAQMRDIEDGRLLDLGTKGSGTTPWSRAGDGRLTLKGGVREILATRMLAALGVDTSKSLSLIETHEKLVRGDEPSPTRSSVLVRLSHSHIRIGTFQRLSYLEETNQIARLINHCITHYMPHCADEDGSRQTTKFLTQVCKNAAITGAHWMQAGFVHGVLNTDNINITGESFDYGPWRFAPTCDPKLTAAYFDENGLYAFSRQPPTLLWNLTRLAETLLPFASKVDLEAVLEQYSSIYSEAFIDSFLQRLSLVRKSDNKNHKLASAFWDFLEISRIPFEQAFFDWHGGIISKQRAISGPCASYYKNEKFKPVLEELEAFEPLNAAALSHPYFRREKPVTMLIDEVEEIWAPIADKDDWTLFENKVLDISLMQSALAASRQTPQ
ncbi:MAG: YdiU family protein [Rhizobiaceae bacterium]|nr:YdiU family protein [Rhizobiaceae bacterium]